MLASELLGNNGRVVACGRRGSLERVLGRRPVGRWRSVGELIVSLRDESAVEGYPWSPRGDVHWISEISDMTAFRSILFPVGLSKSVAGLALWLDA